MSEFIINNADIKEWAANYDGEPFDAILCDPPYELGFMGKSWDSSGIAFDTDMWKDLLRILKPGGHLLAFSGSRTYHRMAVAIEDAGFEIRDMIEWVYGSGFPKSLNIGKAVDKRGGNANLTEEIGEAIKEARLKRGISATQADKMFCGGTTNWSWFEGRPTGQRPPTPETFAKICEQWTELKPYAEKVAEAEREVIGKHPTIKGNGSVFNVEFTNGQPVITAPATEQAKQYEGYGTALKPAHEPCVLARKPIEGTVANNVLKHGTGGLAIDNTRIKPEYYLQGSDLTSIIRVCQLDHLLSPVNSVELKRFQDDTNNAIKRLCSVLETADTPISEKTHGTQQEVIIKKVTSCLEETLTENTNTSLSISGSGKKQTVKTNQKDMKSTISTVSKMITDWKISNSLVSQLIEALLTQAKTLKTTRDAQGRFPSNLIHDGSDEVEAVFPNESSRFFYTAKASKSERNAGLEGFEAVVRNDGRNTELASGHMPQNRSNTPKANHHPTVKPLSLTKYLATLIKPPTGGRLLVPFSGSGSEMIGALQAGWEYVEGVELTEEYIPIAEARIKYWTDKEEQMELVK